MDPGSSKLGIMRKKVETNYMLQKVPLDANKSSLMFFHRMDIEGAEELFTAYGAQTPTSKVSLGSHFFVLISAEYQPFPKQQILDSSQCFIYLCVLRQGRKEIAEDAKLSDMCIFQMH